MKIAVITEVSTRSRNKDIITALNPLGHEVYNVGMNGDENETELTYIHTGFMAGALLNLNAVDMVIGGCGTGQGFLNSAMQYPNVFCGLLLHPADAALFARINAGNCVSLALNAGYGWAGEINLKFILEKLFESESGSGYPPERCKSQSESRRILKSVTLATHRTYEEILASVDVGIIRAALSSKPFRDLVAATGSPVFDKYLGAMK